MHLFNKNMRQPKTFDQYVALVNIEGKATRIAADYEATNGELEICLNDLHTKTLDTTSKQSNKSGDNFFKFKACTLTCWLSPAHCL